MTRYKRTGRELTDEMLARIDAVVSGHEQQHALWEPPDDSDDARWGWELLLECVKTGGRDGFAAALDGLPDRERLIVVLRYYEMLSFAEIAEVLGVTVGRIHEIHTKALRQVSRPFLGDADV